MGTPRRWDGRLQDRKADSRGGGWLFVPNRDERKERRRKMIFLAVAILIVLLFMVQILSTITPKT